MGISIYYTAERATPLSKEEAESIQNLVAKYSVDDQIGDGEPFCIYDSDPKSSSVIFEGATGLSFNTPASVWKGMKHWCSLLSEIRRVLPGAKWHVHLDDMDIPWNETSQAYDVSLMQ